MSPGADVTAGPLPPTGAAPGPRPLGLVIEGDYYTVHRIGLDYSVEGPAGQTYRVWRTTGGPRKGRLACSCKGFEFTFKCKHSRALERYEDERNRPGMFDEPGGSDESNQ